MPEAWLMSLGPVQDQRSPNRREPNVPVSFETLRSIGVLVHSFDPEKMLLSPEGTTDSCPIDALMKELGYATRDEVHCTPEHLPNYNEKLAAFFTEHLHSDDEVRIVKSGSGYFDVRDPQDVWMRIAVTAGDVLLVPAGIYHRFTMDENNCMHAIRLFQTNTLWTPLNRGAGDQDAHKAYVDKYYNAVPHTILGQVNPHNVSVIHPHELDATMKGLVARATPGDVFALYFTGAHKLTLPVSFCPDCRVADPVVVAAMAAATKRGAARSPPTAVTFVECPAERASYLRNPAYPYRTHPFVQLRCIPTLIVVRHLRATADAAHGGDPFANVEVVYRKDDVLDGAWVDAV